MAKQKVTHELNNCKLPWPWPPWPSLVLVLVWGCLTPLYSNLGSEAAGVNHQSLESRPPTWQVGHVGRWRGKKQGKNEMERREKLGSGANSLQFVQLRRS